MPPPILPLRLLLTPDTAAITMPPVCLAAYFRHATPPAAISMPMPYAAAAAMIAIDYAFRFRRRRFHAIIFTAIFRHIDADAACPMPPSLPPPLVFFYFADVYATHAPPL
jgi:hypothetical protein